MDTLQLNLKKFPSRSDALERWYLGHFVILSTQHGEKKVRGRGVPDSVYWGEARNALRHQVIMIATGAQPEWACACGMDKSGLTISRVM